MNHDIQLSSPLVNLTGLWTKSGLLSKIPKNAQYDRVYAPAGTQKKDILGLWYLACGKLTPTQTVMHTMSHLC